MHRLEKFHPHSCFESYGNSQNLKTHSEADRPVENYPSFKAQKAEETLNAARTMHGSGKLRFVDLKNLY